MPENLGVQKKIFYFRKCGEINTKKTLELAIHRAQELDLKKLIVASETGISALKAARLLEGLKISLVVVTSAAGTKVENTAIGDLKIGIPDRKTWNELRRRGATIVRATDPLYNIGAPFEQRGIPTITTVVRMSLRAISSGTAVCVGAVLMATDNGQLREGEEVVAAAGSWVGLDTALVLTAANSVNFLKGALQIREIICKPHYPAYSWPINQKDWMGDLKPYRKFAE